MSAFAIITTVRRCDEFRSPQDRGKSAAETVNCKRKKEIILYLMNSFLFVVAIVAVVVAVLIKTFSLRSPPRLSRIV